MSAPLVTRSTGDTISVNDHNDIISYIEDGTYRVNTLSLSVGGTEVISSARVLNNVTIDSSDIADGSVSNTEFQYLNGVTSSIQTQLNGKLANISEDTTPQLGGELDAGAHSIGFTLQTAIGDGTTTIDWTLGNKFKFTFGAQNETFTFTAPSNPCSLQLILVQDSTGGRTATWPSTVKWANGTAITLSTGANAVDVVSMIWTGSEYLATISKDFS